MFPRLQSRLDGLESHAHGTLSGADNLILLAKDLLLDLRDGFGVMVRPLDGFPQFVIRLAGCLISYATAILMFRIREYLPLTGKQTEVPQLDLAWMVGAAIPLRIEIDPKVDALPPRIAPFVGGPYDGKSYVVDQHKIELVLEGGHHYVWDGKVFAYKP